MTEESEGVFDAAAPPDGTQALLMGPYVTKSVSSRATSVGLSVTPAIDCCKETSCENHGGIAVTGLSGTKKQYADGSVGYATKTVVPMRGSVLFEFTSAPIMFYVHVVTLTVCMEQLG